MGLGPDRAGAEKAAQARVEWRESIVRELSRGVSPWTRTGYWQNLVALPARGDSNDVGWDRLESEGVEQVRITCSSCGEPLALSWLVLGLPWSTYTCARCGAVFAGTSVRLILVSLATLVLGYVVIAVIKGKQGWILLPLPLAVTVAVLLLNFPFQIKQVRKKE